MSEELKKAYKLLEANCGIKAGDTVKVTRKALSYEMGWNFPWAEGMSKMVGNEFKVKEVDTEGRGFWLQDGTVNASFPFFVLEKVKDGKPPFETQRVWLNPAYTAEVTADSVKVGCQTIEFSAIKELALAVKKAQEYNKS